MTTEARPSRSLQNALVVPIVNYLPDLSRELDLGTQLAPLMNDDSDNSRIVDKNETGEYVLGRLIRLEPGFGTNVVKVDSDTVVKFRSQTGLTVLIAKDSDGRIQRQLGQPNDPYLAEVRHGSLLYMHAHPDQQEPATVFMYQSGNSPLKFSPVDTAEHELKDFDAGTDTFWGEHARLRRKLGNDSSLPYRTPETRRPLDFIDTLTQKYPSLSPSSKS